MKRILSVILLILSSYLISCKTQEPVIIKEKEPVKIDQSFTGKAKIVAVKPLKEIGDYESTSFVYIYFDFTADDPSAQKKYAFPEFSDKDKLLDYDNRNTFHKNWVTKWRIQPGREYRAVRIESSGKKTGPHVFYEVELSPEK